jgi:hypothetical protein
MLPVFSKKTSWILILLLLFFDNVVSYWAVAYRGAHEANLSIARLVETYPLTYFLFIPATAILIYAICKFLVFLTGKVFKKVSAKMAERVILTSIVFYWAIGNSSFNLFYLIGWHWAGRFWYPVTGVALVLIAIYTLIEFKTGIKLGK